LPTYLPHFTGMHCTDTQDASFFQNHEATLCIQC